MTSQSNSPIAAENEQGIPKASTVSLIIANTLPLFGVLFLGWTIGVVMLIFWLENVVIGLFNVLRMLVSRKDGIANHLSKVFVVPFFVVHYGIFTAVHGMFVITLFVLGPAGDGIGSTWEGHEQVETQSADSLHTPAPDPDSMADFRMPPMTMETASKLFDFVVDTGLWWAVLALFVSHGISFFTNFIGREEYLHVTASDLMGRPYGRVVVLHIVIIVGAMLVAVTGQPVAALVLLVLLKIGVDFGAHYQERRKLATQEILDELKARAEARRR